MLRICRLTDEGLLDIENIVLLEKAGKEQIYIYSVTRHIENVSRKVDDRVLYLNPLILPKQWYTDNK